jgi:hypothetical protein
MQMAVTSSAQQGSFTVIVAAHLPLATLLPPSVGAIRKRPIICLHHKSIALVTPAHVVADTVSSTVGNATAAKAETIR